MMALSRASLAALRTALVRETGQSASFFQEAGYAGGASVLESFRDWLSQHGHGAPDTLDALSFQALAAEFFGATGWGSLIVGAIGAAALTLDSYDWSEADPEMGAVQPSCFYTTGLFSDFFSRVGGAPVVAYEVECRSTGGSRCRWLLGSPDALQSAYDAMVAGADYEAALRDG